MTIFIPSLSTQAGACLTMENWQEVGVNCVAYAFSALLIKPGIEVLSNYPDLKAYLGWSGQWVLNASEMPLKDDGKCELRSSFDGKILRFDFEALLAIMVRLAPNYVVLPRKLSVQQLLRFSQFSKQITFFIHADTPIQWDDYPEFGVYINDFGVDSAYIADCFKPFEDRLKYLISAHERDFNDEPTRHGGKHQQRTSPQHPLMRPSGTFSPFPGRRENEDVPVEILALSIDLIESDRPAHDALNGLLYAHKECLSVADSSQSMNFDVIDTRCGCPTCLQELTLAYLSHLFANTPLLCHRFLIQHNVFQACHLPYL